ncbi:MAG: AMP-binding protein, partial [Acidobacteria bacterium]|nr:AMP-binding protein [Acidobacteriota bacterium]
MKPDSARPFSTLAAGREEPDRLALVAAEGSWTWSRLAREVGRVVVQLEAQGIDVSGPGGEAGSGEPIPRVAFSGDSSVDAVIFALACFELGVTAVPLHPRWPGAVRKEVLDQIEAAAELLPGGREPGAMPKPLTFAQAAPRPEPAPEAPAAIVYTSGTSGRRKGVVLSRRAFVASAAASAANLGWQDDDRWLLNLPLAHVGGLSVVTRCLEARRTIVIQPPGPFTAEDFAAIVDGHHVTLASLVPTMLRRLLEHQPPWRPPAHLRAVLLGGAPTSPALLETALARGYPVLPTYGLSEACSQVATRRPGQHPINQAASTDSRVAHVGRPLPGTEVRIAEDGEILVRGDTLLSGYFPPGTASPIDDEGWLHTGDQGIFDAQGNLHPTGRRGDLIVTGGENVSPTGVENVLESHPDLRAACVVGIEDPEWGQVVAAAVVPRDPDHRPDLEPFLAEYLASFERPR